MLVFVSGSTDWRGIPSSGRVFTSPKPNVDLDKALRTLTKRLSFETPTVCVMVERIILSGCDKLTDRGLLTVANRCPELSYLDIHSCPEITNIALFEVVSKCVNLETLNVAGEFCIIYMTKPVAV